MHRHLSLTKPAGRPASVAVMAALACAALSTGGGGPAAADLFLGVDIPQTLTDATPVPPDWLLGRSAGAYHAVAALLPDGVEPLAIHRRPDGAWLITPSVPAVLAGLPVGPRDIAITSDGGASFGLILQGDVAGVPDGARIDALFLDQSGAPVVSFDVPVTLGGASYTPSDLVRYGGRAGFSLYWSAEGAVPIPPDANVVGADQDLSGKILIALDVPASLGSADFVPGQVIEWTGPGFASYDVDPGWPGGLQMRDFSLARPVGAVPDGGVVAGVPLTVTHAPGGAITLSWGNACGDGAADYDVYEGRLPAFYSHLSVQCGTGGATTLTLVPGPGSTYYLVVPQNGFTEGSYGQSSSGAEIPAGLGACTPQSIAVCP